MLQVKSVVLCLSVQLMTRFFDREHAVTVEGVSLSITFHHASVLPTPMIAAVVATKDLLLLSVVQRDDSASPACCLVVYQRGRSPPSITL